MAGGTCVAGGGVCGKGCAWLRVCEAGWEGDARLAGKTATAAAGTQPTGMHSCSTLK